MIRATYLICISFLFSSIMNAQCEGAYERPADISNDHRTYLSNYPGAIAFAHPDTIFYNIDKSGEKFNLGFSRGVWVTAYDPALNFKGAISTYPSAIGDYGAGPVILNGESNADRCSFFSRVWKVTQIEVLNLVQAYKINDLLLDDIPLDVLEWPAKGNTHIGSFAPDYDMAPFYDNDQNGQYDPLKGDYPIALIENPDFIPFEMKFSVYNDNVLHRESFFDNLFIEFHQLDYVINCSEQKDSEQAVFTRLKYINRDNTSLVDFKLGIWDDTDLGCFANDYIGCSEALNCTFTYNNNGVDTINCSRFLDENLVPSGSVAVASVVYLNERMKSFIAARPPGIPRQEFDPDDLLSGQWTATDPMTYGGIGFNPGSTDTVKFIFPDRPDLPSEWSMQQVGISNGDYKTVTSLVNKDLEPGEAGIVDFADYVIIDNEKLGLTVFENMEEAINALRNDYNDILDGRFECGNPMSSTAEVNWVKQGSLSLIPNPTSDNLDVHFEEPVNGILTIYAVDGTKILDYRLDELSNYSVDVNDLSKGFYVVNFRADRGEIISSYFIKE